MAWSVQIARAFGIPIRLHITFLLLIGWLAYMGLSRGDLTMLWLALGLFACVLAHELGHSVVAQRFGVQVLDITLLPIGGVARMGSIPRNPTQELWIAIAGPAGRTRRPSDSAMRLETSMRTWERGSSRAPQIEASSSEDASFSPRSTSLR